MSILEKMILFVMSRREDDEINWTVPSPEEKPVQNPEPVVFQEKDTADDVNASELPEGNVTREEMHRLFGSALRVR
ncbi:hypothetical protein K3757_05975 [Sulfitobacter sp. S223]|uniref:hypothetical protein n=1 Tax=Sulfitobacter sp. S223 TaxID=2867023 RepID=UPI0021A44078|nr:hypothetical protein [Sulfitobacter sp. S223]UWR27483.1 hypothetical protein K3757_05975 [Sulfitobacter sp. S223]